MDINKIFNKSQQRINSGKSIVDIFNSLKKFFDKNSLKRNIEKNTYYLKLYELIEKNLTTTLKVLNDNQINYIEAFVKNIREVDDHLININNKTIFSLLQKDLKFNEFEIRLEFNKIFGHEAYMSEPLNYILNFKNYRKFENDLKFLDFFYTSNNKYSSNKFYEPEQLDENFLDTTKTYYNNLRMSRHSYFINIMLQLSSFLETDMEENRHNLKTLEIKIKVEAPFYYLYHDFPSIFQKVNLPQNKKHDKEYNYERENLLLTIRELRNKYLAHKDIYFMTGEKKNHKALSLLSHENADIHLLEIISDILYIGEECFILIYGKQEFHNSLFKRYRKEILFKNKEGDSQIYNLKRDILYLIEIFIKFIEPYLKHSETKKFKIKDFPYFIIEGKKTNKFQKTFQKYNLYCTFNDETNYLTFEKFKNLNPSEIENILEEFQNIIKGN